MSTPLPKYYVDKRSGEKYALVCTCIFEEAYGDKLELNRQVACYVLAHRGGKANLVTPPPDSAGSVIDVDLEEDNDGLEAR